MLTGTLWYGQFFFYNLGHVRMGDYEFTSWAIHMIMLVLVQQPRGLALSRMERLPPAYPLGHRPGPRPADGGNPLDELRQLSGRHQTILNHGKAETMKRYGSRDSASGPRNSTNTCGCTRPSGRAC